jgi:spermidine synthase
MYHVIGTGLTAILLYLISYFFYRFGFYSAQFHNKLWNSLLATAFILTSIAGVFMALQINYKWDIPFVKTVLKWHVEFGIGLTLTGIFHFIWHFSYFKKLFKKSDIYIEYGDSVNMSSSEINSNLFIVGFVSSSVQLLLIREMMNISGGYELITGIFLCSWLIGSAIGAALAGKSPLFNIRRINLIFAMSPVVSLMLMIFLSRLFLKTGETPSFLVSMISTFLILIPFCLVSGFTFVKLITIAASGNNYQPGKSFSIETAGGVASGILVSVLTSGLINTYKLLLLIILLAIAYVLLNFFLRGLKAKIILKILFASLGILIIIFNPDLVFRKLLLPGVKVTETEDTPYGNITEGNYKGEVSVYYNQRLLAYNDDVIEREENIHYAMLQCESPDKVILVSGSLQSHLPEILKYPVKKIIYIERDPALARSALSSSDGFQGELVIANNDAFRFIRNSKEMVDVIILLIPPPTTLLLNRYYSTEFFKEVKKILNPGGIFMCSPGPGDNYLNEESLNLYSSIINSLKDAFKSVMPVVGNKMYFIASDKKLSLSYCQIIERRGIDNIYVSQDYLADDLIALKSDKVNSLIDYSIRQNRYAYPVASFYSQSYNFSKNADEKLPAILLMILVFAVPVITIKRANLLMYFSASALAGYEIIILLTLQLIMGNMYQFTGLIIAGLMTGLAVGAGADIKFLRSYSPGIKSLTLLIFYICIGLIYNNIITIQREVPGLILIMVSAFLPAFMTGHLFRDLTTERQGSSIPSAVYSADLAGSAFGFIFISGFAVPALGIKVSVFLLSSLVFAGILFGTFSNK